MKQVQYAVVGAGVGGLAVAYFLAKKGAKGVLLLEQERMLGLHASGKNAGMIRQIVPNPAVGRLTQKGADFLRRLPPAWKVSFRRCGSLLLVKGKEKKEKLHRSADFAERLGLSFEWVTVKQVVRRISILGGADFEEALFCPTDGVVAIHALLSGYLRAARREGAAVWMGARVKGIDVDPKGGFCVETTRGRVRAETLVNAAGAWVGPVGKMAGAQSIPFRAIRRHLLLSRPMREIDPNWPFVWDVTHALYFRPEEGGMVLSPCDEDRLSPCRSPADRTLALERLARRLIHFPNFPKFSVRRVWSGLRTFSPDDTFCVGWDGKREGFFWVAGLDGHGMTTGSAVGEFASDMLLGKKADPELARSFSPKRFQGQP